ncbi:tRNA preQ1(34) S-adenosylmethionine ribosyltransferase-isomerase QueA [Methylomonas paludis]|uniref:S-adenosylmethionine:tRNA ribosyltransferase-isomerase n=1 Tax=Methylomonas paludis TaxID=1173101 RepID=A0A975RBD0_9GAMM|nr:tRNA preQ1(34) S-adenosylmethionine ribosyltransferase-isomerase QueA [Methylomonas paludis]QWF72244.1 tRNA preQ1(34) S-adenosylmethionine ribosyltransferase-isomerase QueA [Methylomonas paludis]
MKKSDFNYDLPADLIAQQPLAERGASRMLQLDKHHGSWQDAWFSGFIDLLKPEDLLVFNDTKVIPARLYAQKTSGGKVEMLIERVVDNRQAWAHIKASKAPKADAELILSNGQTCRVLGREHDLFLVEFPAQQSLLSLLAEIGHIPLPPYITRADTAADLERYQTVFAKNAGAVAAPTAGLHFDQALLDELDRRGIGKSYVTLHVGSGTFQPVRVENLAEHIMHQEFFQVSAATVAAVRQTRARGGRVVAIGTTAVRALESAAAGGELEAGFGDTRLFITPGYQFKVVDALLTNFHLPESTLLMLISAFAGYEPVMAAYRHAIAQRYRFFSYGDAMAIF